MAIARNGSEKDVSEGKVGWKAGRWGPGTRLRVRVGAAAGAGNAWAGQRCAVRRMEEGRRECHVAECGREEGREREGAHRR